MQTFTVSQPVDVDRLNAASMAMNTDLALTVLMKALNDAMDAMRVEVEKAGITPDGTDPLPQITVTVAWTH